MDISLPKKPFKLEERTILFAVDTRNFLKELTLSTIINDDIRQLVRSSGSVGANFIEAQESLGRKDCIKQLKICRKESRESAYWLELISVHKLSAKLDQSRINLQREAIELTKIFSSMIIKAEKRQW